MYINVVMLDKLNNYGIYIMSKEGKKCICKTGPKGTGPRCSVNAKQGSNFCGIHLKKCLNTQTQEVPSSIPKIPSSIPNIPSSIPLNIPSISNGFMETRIRNYHILKAQFANLNPCIIEKEGKLILTGYKHPIVFDKRIGSESGAAVAYKAHTEEGPIYFSAKIMMEENDNRNEIEILKKLTELALTGNYPNFPLMYTVLTCNSVCVTSGCPAILKDKYIVVLNELADGDTQWWFTKKYTDKVYKSVILQMIYTINAFHNVGYVHNDMHLGNFLVHKIKPGGFFTYTINNVKINVPNCGYLLVIWDFGQSSKIGQPYFSDFIDSVNEITGIKKWGVLSGIMEINERNSYMEVINEDDFVENVIQPLPSLTQKWLLKIINYIRDYDYARRGSSEDKVISSLPI